MSRRKKKVLRARRTRRVVKRRRYQKVSGYRRSDGKRVKAYRRVLASRPKPRRKKPAPAPAKPSAKKRKLPAKPKPKPRKKKRTDYLKKPKPAPAFDSRASGLWLNVVDFSDALYQSYEPLDIADPVYKGNARTDSVSLQDGFVWSEPLSVRSLSEINAKEVSVVTIWTLLYNSNVEQFFIFSSNRSLILNPKTVSNRNTFEGAYQECLHLYEEIQAWAKERNYLHVQRLVAWTLYAVPKKAKDLSEREIMRRPRSHVPMTKIRKAALSKVKKVESKSTLRTEISLVKEQARSERKLKEKYQAELAKVEKMRRQYLAALAKFEKGEK